MSEQSSPDNVVVVRLSGKATAADIAAYKHQMEDKLKAQTQLGMYVDISDLSDLSADALKAGIHADMEMFGHLNQFGRIAFVSDKEWPQALVALAAPFLPSLDMKTFPSTQHAEALAWAAALSVTP